MQGSTRNQEVGESQFLAGGVDHPPELTLAAGSVDAIKAIMEIQMPTINVTKRHVDADGNYTGPSLDDYQGDISFGASLGTVRLPRSNL